MTLFDKSTTLRTGGNSEIAALSLNAPAWNRRAIRIAILLAVIALLNAVDLTYTLFAHHIGWLREMNPVAESFLSQGLEPSLICYKLLMVLAGSTMLWRLRSSGWTAPACWFIIAAYCGLTVLWYLWTGEVVNTYESQLAWTP